MSNSNYNKYLPIIYALILVLGMFIGATFKFNNSNGILPITGNYGYNKIGALLRYIHSEYVDTVDEKQIVEDAITQVLYNLDPHSVYIPADEIQLSNEPLKGHFVGIGVEFSIIDDTVNVINVIEDGPAQKAGLLTADKLILVDSIAVAGIGISNKDIMSKLKGEKNTKVLVQIKRNKAQFEYEIIRSTIPIYSIETSKIIEDSIGYIKISRFAATTHSEYIKAFDQLKEQGLKELIIDLRGNSGGYLNTAVELCDEFLDAGKQIVYTEGKSRPKEGYKATLEGNFKTGKLVVLIDERSASASEILAGAVQDNDRGTIIGRRSFGKGLVQEQNDFSDGSAIRLTIARYYTPTGRCIQKDYTNGVEEYYEEEGNRLLNGELQDADSIRFNDSLKFITPGGKVVYGGGGIFPDIFIPYNVEGITRFYNDVINQGLVNDFAFRYIKNNSLRLKKYATIGNFYSQFEVTPNLYNKFITHCKSSELVFSDREVEKSSIKIKLALKSLIAKNIFGKEGYYFIVHKTDSTLLKTVSFIKKDKLN